MDQAASNIACLHRARRVTSADIVREIVLAALHRWILSPSLSRFFLLQLPLRSLYPPPRFLSLPFPLPARVLDRRPIRCGRVSIVRRGGARPVHNGESMDYLSSEFSLRLTQCWSGESFLFYRLSLSPSLRCILSTTAAAAAAAAAAAVQFASGGTPVNPPLDPLPLYPITQIKIGFPNHS